MRYQTIIALLAAATFTPVLAAQMMPVARRTYGLLASDSTLSQLFLMRDLNNDGDALDANETTVFLDSSNASALPATGNVFCIAQSVGGSIYLGEGDTDTVYRVRDVNNDGDAQDAGEVNAWYQATSTVNRIPSPNGIGFGPDGAVYIVTAGVNSQGIPAAIIRTTDLNHDGDALDEGESSLWLDAATLIPGSSAFHLAFVGDTAYLADLRGGAPDAIMRLRDLDGNKTITADEINVFIEDGNPFGVPCSFTAVSDGASIHVHESTSSVSPQRIFRLTDLNASGAIDSAKEAREVWNELLIPVGGPIMGNSFDIAVGPAGMAISSNGADNVDNIFLMRDLDASGDYLAAGETTVFQSGNGSAFAENVRALQFVGDYCRADWTQDGTLNSQDFFDFLTSFFANNADFNSDGVTNSQDFFDFLTNFFAGCD